MLKCSNLMYCFEIDGTIVDNVPYDNSYIVRNNKLLLSKCIFNPKKYDIRWNIITKRPLIDYIFIKMTCLVNGLVPSQIITSKFFKKEKDVQYIAYNKLNLFKKILDGKFKVKYTKDKVRRIINVCNDQTENYYINSKRDGYDIISVNIIDFERGFFNEIV